MDESKPRFALQFLAPAAFDHLVKENSENDNQADNNLLVVRRNIHQSQTIGQHTDQQNADDGTKNSTLAAKEAGAANDYPGNHRQFITNPGYLFGRI